MGKIEYEYRFKDYDKKKIIKAIKDNGGKLKYPKQLLRISVYHHPLKKKNFYIRVREEGGGIMMTVKKTSGKFDKEYEVEVNDHDEANEILKLLGCKLKYYVEKFRETWELKGCKEIVFDEYPAAPEYMEVECNNKKILDNMIKKLGFTKDDIWKGGLADLYKKEYDMKQQRKKDGLSFKIAKKKLGEYVTKNKTLFNSRIKEQLNFLKNI